VHAKKKSVNETESKAEFPYTGILLVVAVGVAMGVFVGGVLLVCAARHVRRYDFSSHD